MKYLKSILSSSSLTAKLTSIFALVCLSTAILFSAVTIYCIFTAESLLMSSTMESYLNGMVYHDIKQGREPLLDNFTRLYIQNDRVRPIPERFADLPVGYSEYIKGEDLHVFVKDYEGTRYVMTHYQGEFEQWEQKVWILCGLIILAVGTLCAVCGFFWLD